MNAKNTTKTKNDRARQMEAAMDAARKSLRIETLADRGSDRLDFHTLSVAQIRDALAIAFDAGFAAAERPNR